MTELRLRGVFVESARKNLLLGDKESRPMLKTAAELGVPVFVHPQTDPELHKRFARTGGIGRRYARGTINGAALINMVESGAFDEAPRLQMVITTLAFGALMLVAGFGNGQISAATPRHWPAVMSISTPWDCIPRWCGRRSICSAPIMC